MMANLFNNKGFGYCMICGKKVKSQDINNPYCYKHKRITLNLKITDLINGTYCHICGNIGEFSNYQPYCLNCKGFDRDSNLEDEYYLKILRKYWKSENLIFKALWNTKSQQHKIKTISCEDLVKLTNLNSSFNLRYILDNEVKSNKRILNTLERWSIGLEVDPPQLINKNGEVYFKDGRHRTLAAIYIKEQNIPVIFDSD